MLGLNNNAGFRAIGLRLRWVVVGGVLTLAPVALANVALATDGTEDIAPAVTEQNGRENSVLVAVRQGEPTPAQRPVGAEAEEPLDPITFESDQEPQLADPNAMEANLPTQRQVVRVASTRNDCSATETQTSAPQLAMFHGIQPGVSTKSELTKAWGSPKEASPTETGELLSYQVESFRGVQILVENGVVSLIKIQLVRPESPASLAAKVKAGSHEAANVYDDETGDVLGQVYPERGIVLVFDASDDIRPATEPQVSLMILQPLDPQAFSMRGEQRPRHDVSGRLADLTKAVAIAPADAEANWMLAELQLELGRGTEAIASARRAYDAEPTNAAYRLRWAECLHATGQYDAAVLETRAVLDTEGVPSLIEAQANHRLGLLAMLGDAEIAATAIDYHKRAIEGADKLAISNDRYVRRQAKQLLVDAHLAIGLEVSRRDYENKGANVADWVSRASSYAEEMIANGDVGLEARLHVAQCSLEALANFKPAKDPAPLLNEIEQTLDELLDVREPVDPLWKEQLYWGTGVAYLHAMQINHQRGEVDAALGYADRAVEYLSDVVEQRQDSPQTQQLVGRLYFHIGALHAVHNEDHASAVLWYDKAIPLMAAKEEPSELVVPRHEGEALVSMAVSFWNEGERVRALALTEAGAALIEQGVTAGVLEQKTLEVPYGNLAAMHKLLGNAEESERFTRLSQNAAKPQPKLPQASSAIRRIQPSNSAARPANSSEAMAQPTADGATTPRSSAAPVGVGQAPRPRSASSNNGASGSQRPLSGRSSRNNHR